MADDYRIVVAGGNPAAKLPPVGRFKIPLGGDQHFGVGIELQNIGAPLLRQVIGNYKQRFLAQAQPLAFHGGGNAAECLTAANGVSSQAVTAVEDMGNHIFLMRPQGNLGIHAWKGQVAPIVFTGANGVEPFIVPGN